MKQLFTGVLLIAALGIGGLLYRNALERPMGEYQACADDARVCPDGTAVGRTGPACSFAPCPSSSVERADIGISFVVPEGFTEGGRYDVSDVVTGYSRTGEPELADAIIIRQHTIPEGSTGEQVMFAHTLFSPRGEHAAALSEYTTESIGGRTFYIATLERFEAHVHTAFYLIREDDVLVFEALDRNVTEWMNPALDIATLPTQKDLRALLETLQIAH